MGIANQDGSEHKRWLMPAGSRSWELSDFEVGDEAWLVVAAIDDNADDGETHSYQFDLSSRLRRSRVAAPLCALGRSHLAGLRLVFWH